MTDWADERAEQLLPCIDACHRTYKDINRPEWTHFLGCLSKGRPAVAAALRAERERGRKLAEVVAEIREKFGGDHPEKGWDGSPEDTWGIADKALTAWQEAVK